MDDLKRTQQMLDQLAGKAIATMTVWADANERVLREVLDFSALGAKEGARLYGELQQSALQALRDSHAAAGRLQEAWQGGAGDPLTACQKMLSDGFENAQKALARLESQSQALGRSVERLSTSAEHAAKDIHGTYTAVIAKLRDVYSQS